MFQRSLWDGSRIGERKKTVISNAERIVLRNMYPSGCRVELEDMEADPYVKLSPGDLGTVQFVDDGGQIHVSWDCGYSLAMVFGVDHCKCVMREERLQEILQRIQAMPFESLEKMERYVMEKLSGVFPKISFQKKEGQEVFVDMGVAAFMKKGLATGITIESKDNKVLTYKAGEKKTWTFTVTNHSGNPMNNVTVTPDLGDDNDVWPFKTEMQSYQQNIGTLEN